MDSHPISATSRHKICDGKTLTCFSNLLSDNKAKEERMNEAAVLGAIRLEEKPGRSFDRASVNSNLSIPIFQSNKTSRHLMIAIANTSEIKIIGIKDLFLERLEE